MPPAIIPLAIISSAFVNVTVLIKESTSSLSVHTPATSVINTNFCAFNAAAIAPAAVSAFTFNAFPFESCATVAITGTNPPLIKVVNNFGSTDSISPTHPKSLSFTFPLNKFPSLPQTPTALPPPSPLSAELLLINATNSLFTFPVNTISTTSIVASSVTRNPFLKFGSIPTTSNILLISGPPPCTKTMLIPTVASKHISRITAAFSSFDCIAAPPYFTTTVCP
mmetsp:Transcript_7831/g.24571  ORF Transcript_7831/g.24571 Transcript_7831/m.24571 type:complete len:224 (+) Transcript_7831:5458-6129(+)